MMKEQFLEFLNRYESAVIPLSRETALANFNAAISGKKEDFDKSSLLQIQLSKIHSNKNEFVLLKKIKESNEIAEPILKRQLDLAYDLFLAHQIDEVKLEQIINLQTKIENLFSTYRTELNGKKLSDNEIDNILKTSFDSNELKETWEASKQIGKIVSDDVIKLVKLRNEAASELGFKNYHDMSLILNEQLPEEIDRIFDELDSLTRNKFEKIKNQIDDYLSKRFNLSKDELYPWHYQNRFFQEPPKIFSVDFDKYYKSKNLVDITEKYFSNIGLPINDLIAKSDLFEKEGKYQHAFCTDIDKNGDVRVVCNVNDNYRWMGTLLHEYGHAVYDKFKNLSLPWLLKEPAHTFTTEAIAMMFGRFASNPQWLIDEMNVAEDEIEKIQNEAEINLQFEQIVFSRWAQVMYRFEKKLYENPEQDLNSIWWQLVENFQLLKNPNRKMEQDWASKIHISLYPAYYHNYLLGELLASQIYFHIQNKVVKNKESNNSGFSNCNEVGNYLIEKIFLSGRKLSWNEMIENATGEKLTAKYYAKQFLR